MAYAMASVPFRRISLLLVSPLLAQFLRRLAAYLLVGAASVAALLAVAQLTIYLLIATYANIAPYAGAG